MNEFSYPLLMTPIVLWDLAWRGLALWHAARNEQKKWFVVLLVINSAGIVPIAYYYFFRISGERPPKNALLTGLGLIAVSIVLMAIALKFTFTF